MKRILVIAVIIFVLVSCCSCDTKAATGIEKYNNVEIIKIDAVLLDVMDDNVLITYIYDGKLQQDVWNADFINIVDTKGYEFVEINNKMYLNIHKDTLKDFMD